VIARNPQKQISITSFRGHFLLPVKMVNDVCIVEFSPDNFEKKGDSCSISGQIGPVLLRNYFFDGEHLICPPLDKLGEGIRSPCPSGSPLMTILLAKLELHVEV